MISSALSVLSLMITDICRIIEKAILNNMTGIYTLGTEKVYTLKDLYAAIALRLNKKPVFISVPYELVDIALGTIEALRIPFNVSKENLLGLKQLKAFETKDDIKKLGVSISDMDESLDQLMNNRK